MKIVSIDRTKTDRIAPLVADFRTVLLSYRNIDSLPDIAAATDEVLEFLEHGYPFFAMEDDGEYIGYIICRTEGSCVWVEHLFVKEEWRRKGVASALFGKAEEIAVSLGEETVFNFVHPNNGRMIGFLRSKGYTVLNMIEVRKPYEGERLSTVINVGDNGFDY